MMFLLIKINLAHSLLCSKYAKRSLDIFIKLYLSVIFPVLAQPFAAISLKLTKPFPSKHGLCALVILSTELIV
jgi:hypothetical protein